jgi:hypothetical protein
MRHEPTRLTHETVSPRWRQGSRQGAGCNLRRACPLRAHTGSPKTAKALGLQLPPMFLARADGKRSAMACCSGSRGVLQADRNPAEILLFTMMTVITAATSEAARAKLEDYRFYVSKKGALVLMSGWTGNDFSKYEPDEPIRYSQQDVQTSALEAFTIADPDRVWTVREIARHAGIGGRGPVVVGAPEEIADELIAWKPTWTGLIWPTQRHRKPSPTLSIWSCPSCKSAVVILQTRLRARHAARKALRSRSRGARRGSSSGEVPQACRSARQPISGSERGAPRCRW